MLIYLKPERIKRETEKAYCLQCPESSYSYARATFWVSKGQAKRRRVGDYQYLEVRLPATGEVELRRYYGRRKTPDVFKVKWAEIRSMFQLEHEGIWRRLNAEYQNQAADRWFENQMRGY